MTQVLSYHADLNGFGEVFIIYNAPYKLEQLNLSVKRHTAFDRQSDCLLDKLLHNQYDSKLPDLFLEARVLFVLREPIITIQPTTDLFTLLSSHEHASHEQSTKYYITRVKRLKQLWLQFLKSRRLFIGHERHMEGTNQCLEDMSTLLDLSSPLVNEYQPTKIRRGSSDPLVSTRMSQIVSQILIISIKLGINPDLMAQAEATYLEALKLFSSKHSTHTGIQYA
jgi:hypothetical protein